MGTWGTKILQNDNTLDLYERLQELYEQKQEIGEIKNIVFIEYADFIIGQDTFCDFWFTWGLFSWEVCALDTETFTFIEKLILEDQDLVIWENLHADTQTIKDRKKELLNFLRKIKKQRNKPLKLISRSNRPPIFKNGDIVYYKVEDLYGGLIIVGEQHLGEYIMASNTVLSTRLLQKEIPTIEEILNSELLFLNFGYWKNKLSICEYRSDTFKLSKNDFFFLGNIQLDNEIINYWKKNNSGLAGDWGNIPYNLSTQLQHEKLSSPCLKKKKLIDYLEKKINIT